MNPYLITAIVTTAACLICHREFYRTDRWYWLAGVYVFCIFNLWNLIGYFATGAGA